MLRQIFLAASLASIVFAAPTSTSSTLDPRNAYDFSPQLADFYSAVSQEISKVKSSPAYASGLSSCNMDNAAANFPSSPTTLPSPSTGSKLKHVLLGMGYQNYTCPSVANSTAIPTAIGAFARLFNVSCIAANYPDILTTLPALAYQYPLSSEYYPTPGTIGESAAEEPTGSYSYQPVNVIYSGLHTFMNLTTPRFDLDVPDAGFQNGLVLAKKAASSTAWPNATQGTYGAVPYLALNAIAGTTGGYTNVYRMETQGGANPPTCGSQTGEFGIPYTATYWYFATS